jgi:hypothetical protein
MALLVRFVRTCRNRPGSPRSRLSIEEGISQANPLSQSADGFLLPGITRQRLVRQSSLGDIARQSEGADHVAARITDGYLTGGNPGFAPIGPSLLFLNTHDWFAVAIIFRSSASAAEAMFLCVEVLIRFPYDFRLLLEAGLRNVRDTENHRAYRRSFLVPHRTAHASGASQSIAPPAKSQSKAPIRADFRAKLSRSSNSSLDGVLSPIVSI